ncbi:hypothetical protein XENOCAPTIV_021829, partial [Xenoophorus captivus]
WLNFDSKTLLVKISYISMAWLNLLIPILIKSQSRVSQVFFSVYEALLSLQCYHVTQTVSFIRGERKGSCHRVCGPSACSGSTQSRPAEGTLSAAHDVTSCMIQIDVCRWQDDCITAIYWRKTILEWLALTAVFVETGPTEGAGRADRIRFAGDSQKSQPEGSIRDSVQTDSLNLWSTPSDPEVRHLEVSGQAKSVQVYRKFQKALSNYESRFQGRPVAVPQGQNAQATKYTAQLISLMSCTCPFSSTSRQRNLAVKWLAAGRHTMDSDIKCVQKLFLQAEFLFFTILVHEWNKVCINMVGFTI